MAPEPFSLIWDIHLSLKIRIFLWQWMRGRLPSGIEVLKRNGPGSEYCALCGALEDTNYIFFHCVLSKLVWRWVRSLLQVTWNPFSFPELRNLANLLVGETKRVF